MALSYSRLFCRRGLDFHHFRSLYTSSSRGITSSLVKSTAVPVCETHDEKNARLKRPLSPHLTIYKFELPAIFSITHRATGMILSTYGMMLAYGTLFVPGGMNGIVSSIDAMCLPIPVLFLAKYLLALPATYHYFNGMRHLIWDLGQFLTMKGVYKTGYTVLALTIVSALGLAAMF
ncbi:succinate dehydrogenase cytochrome b560 subunit, mitochondrial-like [Venturia canescens]|uniref:succinate dehydrogenase cytochrome b560 subunit, mitochondrial-like n=1 Tax=Venturia canescens TaxID=32260 RepID=UPI001C9D23E8|nr:succinate dehydrogenase cytochrome b560 subunit, mitochondrial-like [Venturia canescens]